MMTTTSRTKIAKRRFGTRLKTLREKVEMTQAEVADRFQFSTSQFVSNWERGLSLPPVKTLGKLAKIYKTKPETLLADYVGIKTAQFREQM